MSYKNFLVMLFFLMLFMTAPLLSLAQEQQGAVASVQAQRARQQKTASELGEGGVGGTDLRSIASPKKQGTTFTGFPGGAEPDSEARSEVEQPKVLSPEGRIVLSGSPINSILSSLPLGSPLDRICSVSDHMGYRLSPLKHSFSILDSPYSCVLSHGRKTIATLYLDRSLKLTRVQ